MNFMARQNRFSLAAQAAQAHSRRMDEFALSVRQARPSDAADLARIYIQSWQDTYAGLLSHTLLGAMSHKRQTERWLSAIRGPGSVLVADHAREGVIGLSSMGAARDAGLGLEGEIYTLYVDPACLGRGIGRALLAGGFKRLRERRMQSCLIWAHAGNNACYFYEAMGGKRIAQRTTRLMGEVTPEVCFGWTRLACERQNRPVKS